MYLGLSLVILLFYNALADNDIDQKYIDLLPENEKQMFLDKVARRLLEGVKAKNIAHGATFEVSNDDLDKQGEFVQRILEEESASLRKRTDDKNEQYESKNQDDKKSQGVKSGHIDLTLRNGKRIRRGGIENEPNEAMQGYNVPVKTVYDDANEKTTEPNNKDNKAHDSGEQSDGKDIQVRGINNKRRKHEDSSHTQIINYDPDDETTDSGVKEDLDDSGDVTTTYATAADSDEAPHSEKSHYNGATVSIYESQDGKRSSENVETSETVDNETTLATKTTTLTTETVPAPTTTPVPETTKTTLLLTTVTEKLLVTTTIPSSTTKKSQRDNSKNAKKEKPKRYLRSGSVENTNDTDTTENILIENVNSITNGTIDDITYSTETTTEQVAEYSSTVDNTAENTISTTTEDLNSSTDSIAPIDNTSDSIAANYTTLTDTSDNTTESILDVDTTEHTNTEDINTTPTEDITRTVTERESEANNVTEDASNVTVTTENIFTPHPEDVTDAVKQVIDKINKTKSISKESALADAATDKEAIILNNLVNALRSGVEFKEMYTETTLNYGDDEIKVTNGNYPPVRPKKRTYIVYEIPADEEPFVKKEIKQSNDVQKQLRSSIDQPYYVPIYNYSPENAYFNPYNRLGPNYDLSNEEFESRDNANEDDYSNISQLNSNALRKFKFDSKKKHNTHDEYHEVNTKNTVKNYKLRMPVVVKKPKFTEIYFNPDDYLDMDYYFGRRLVNSKKIKRNKNGKKDVKKDSKKRFVLPGIYEVGHPFINMKNNLSKDHLNGVRLMLYQHQIFGYVPTVPPVEYYNGTLNLRAQSSGEKSKEQAYIPNNSRLRSSDLDRKENIASDYYYGLSHNVIRSGLGNNRDSFEEDEDYTSTHRHFNSWEQTTAKINDDRNKATDNENETILKWVNIVGKTDRAKKKKEKLKGGGTIRELLLMDNSKEIFSHLQRLLDLNLPLGRERKDGEDDENYEDDELDRNNDDLEPFVTALSNMIQSDNQSLVQYDWLGTTVDILSAVDKISAVVDILERGDRIHKSDYQLLKYIEFLYVNSKQPLEKQIQRTKKVREKNTVRRSLLPRRLKKKRSPNFLKEKGLINRVWLYRERLMKKKKLKEKKELNEMKNLRELKKTLVDVRNCLYDLHNALSHLSTITKFKNQRWYHNLKDLYFKDADRREVLVVLLHITAARFLNLIEDGAKLGAGRNYLSFIETHEKEVTRAKEELSFLLKVLKEINLLNSQ